MSTNEVKDPATTPKRTRKAAPEYKSKSDHVRALLRKGMLLKDIVPVVPGMGYAFAYGIADRYPLPKDDPRYEAGVTETYADVAAGRRAEKSIVKTDGAVIVTTAVGRVRVDLVTGKATKVK